MTDTQSKLAEIMSEARNGADNRRHRRVRLPLPVRYMLPDKSEHTGKIVNIGASGALVKSHPSATCGDEILIYIRQLGRFEATVVRVERDGFAVRFKPKRNREFRTADSLTWLFNDGEKYLNRRRAQRIRQDKPATAILEDGTEMPCRILDISVTGASVKLDPKPPVGKELVIGRMPARIVRHHNDGIGVEFIKPTAQ